MEEYRLGFLRHKKTGTKRFLFHYNRIFRKSICPILSKPMRWRQQWQHRPF
jgi:hypothetical protein